MPAAVSMSRKSSSAPRLVERLAERVPLRGAERGQRLQARAGRDDLDADGPFDDDLVERLLAGHHVADVAVRRQAQQHVDVAEPEVRVEHADAVAEARQRHGDVDGDVGLADAALAARDGEDRGARRARCAVSCEVMPMRSDGVACRAPTTPAAAGVARCRSSGTRCPVPRYEIGNPARAAPRRAGASDSASSSFVRTRRDGLRVAEASSMRRAGDDRQCWPEAPGACARPARRAEHARRCLARRRRPAIARPCRQHRTLERARRRASSSSAVRATAKRRVEDVGVERAAARRRRRGSRRRRPGRAAALPRARLRRDLRDGRRLADARRADEHLDRRA